MSTRPLDLIDRLGLRPHPEGGHYAEVFRSPDTVQRSGDTRSALTTIHFLLGDDEISRWHVVTSDEVWHHLEGAPLELVTYDPAAGHLESVILGSNRIEGGTNPHVVRAGVWQAARPRGSYALAGCTMGPGFEFEDFRFVRDLPGHETVFSGVLADYEDLL